MYALLTKSLCRKKLHIISASLGGRNVAKMAPSHLVKRPFCKWLFVNLKFSFEKEIDRKRDWYYDNYNEKGRNGEKEIEIEIVSARKGERIKGEMRERHEDKREKQKEGEWQMERRRQKERNIHKERVIVREKI
jgi:hypothetical protein